MVSEKTTKDRALSTDFTRRASSYSIKPRSSTHSRTLFRKLGGAPPFFPSERVPLHETTCSEKNIMELFQLVHDVTVYYVLIQLAGTIVLVSEVPLRSCELEPMTCELLMLSIFWMSSGWTLAPFDPGGLSSMLAWAPSSSLEVLLGLHWYKFVPKVFEFFEVPGPLCGCPDRRLARWCAKSRCASWCSGWTSANSATAGARHPLAPEPPDVINC